MSSGRVSGQSVGSGQAQRSGADDFGQLREHRIIGADDLAIFQHVIAGRQRLNKPTCLFDNQQARCNVPGVQTTLPIAIITPRRHIGQIQRRGPKPAHPGTDRHQAGKLFQCLGQVRAPTKRQPGGKQALNHPRPPRHPQPGVVHKRALPLFGKEQFVLGRVINHPRHNLPLVLQRDRHRPMGQPVQEICRSVQRIHDPATRRIFARLFAALLGQPAIGRARRAQLFSDDGFGGQICLGHKVTRPLGRDLKVLHLAEVLDQRPACLARGLDHDVKICAADHGVAPKGDKGSEARYTLTRKACQGRLRRRVCRSCFSDQ
mmetsp:Transcript_23684/g.42285  ORF Transcript_23684/g.42285 Transcript_23684/m.42285 type:complete len:318 (+) Transcript_23684:1126-2079(+)